MQDVSVLHTDNVEDSYTENEAFNIHGQNLMYQRW